MADERWLDVADNRGEWTRLRRALALEQGFALFVVDVPDVETEGRVVELLAGERELLVLDAREGGEQAPVRELLRRSAGVAVLRSVEASRRDLEALERCLAQLNARRDQLVARGHVLVIVLRRDAVARMLDVAPDLYSVHRARARFATLVGSQPAPLWLLPDVEYPRLLSSDFAEFFRAAAEQRGDVDVFELWSGTQRDPEESSAGRLFARCEGVRSLAPGSDLLRALESPSVATSGLLHESMQKPPWRSIEHLCAVALVWVYRSESRLSEARSALDRAKRRAIVLPYAATRVALLERHLDVAEGIADAGSFEPSRGPTTLVAAAALLSEAGLEWTVAPNANATDTLRAVQAWIERGGRGSWRLDPCFAALPLELVRATNSTRRCADAIAWLRDRLAAKHPSWVDSWVEHLMVARALGGAAELVDLGRAWIATPGRQRIDAVWRPLVDVHAEAKDLATLEQLIRMPLAPDAPERFGPRLPAALHVTAEILDRGLIELPPRERAQLRARAAARAELPLAMRLGWWAIELALAER